MPLDRSRIVTILKGIHLFRGLDDPQLEAIAAMMEEMEYKAGSRIYQEGTGADFFYIIADGNVRLTRLDRGTGQPVSLGCLDYEDYFGEEVLETGWPRQVSVDAETDVTLLLVSVPVFIAMIEQVPALGQRLQLILDSYKLMLKTYNKFAWRDKDEAFLFIARRHVLFLAGMLLPPLISALIAIPLFSYLYLITPMLSTLVLLAMVVIVLLVWLVWNYVDWTNDYYIVTSQRILYQERVILIYDSRQESPLQAIQSTTINTSLWGRWFGYGNVAIRTFYGVLLFRSVTNPEQVMALIQEQQLRAQFRQRRTDIRSIGDFLNNRIRFGPPPPILPGAKKAQIKPDPMREFIATMFHLRFEQGRTIIYRTHWFRLLQKIGLPSLILLGIFSLFTTSVSSQFAMLSVQATCGLTFLAGIVALGWWLYQYMDWHNDLYLITNEQVIDVNKKPLGREERQAAPIKNILSIEYKRIGIIGLVLNFGTVYVRVGDKQLTFDDVYKPSEVQRELFHRLAEVNNEEKRKQAEEEKQRLGDWFASYNDFLKQNPPGPSQPPAQQGGF